MRAVVYAGARSVRVESVPEPTLLEPGDALVRPSLCGICGTDLHLLAHENAGIAPGLVLGHEFVGEVVAVGPGVRHIRPGARVFGADFTACGHCRWCARGDHWECAERRFFGTGDAFGAPLAGAQAELVRVPFADTVLLALPDAVSDANAILLADNLPTGWAAVERSGLRPGETVAIVGGGAIGQLTSLCAQAAGAGIVVVVEPNAERRAFAGAHGALGVAPGEADSVLRELTDGDGADVVVEAGGNAATLNLAPVLVRRRGRIVVLGVPSAERWDFPLTDSFAGELSFTFAVGDAMRTRRTLLALLKAGTLDPGDLVAPSVPLGEAPAAYAELTAQRALKLMLDPRR